MVCTSTVYVRSLGWRFKKAAKGLDPLSIKDDMNPKRV